MSNIRSSASRTDSVQTSHQTEADMVVLSTKGKRGRRLLRALFIVGWLALTLCVSIPPGAKAEVAAGSVMHVVGPGETLWSISHRYDVSIDQLIRLNELSDPDRLVIGQKLVIREGEALVHVVQPGDTLSAIARHYDVRQQDLIALNELSRPDLLSVGQELVIVPRWQRSHVVQAGDTLWDIARTYGVTVEAIEAANPEANPRAL